MRIWTRSTPRRTRKFEPGQYVLIAVSDTGTGMTKEVIAKAFEPFFTTKDRWGRAPALGCSRSMASSNSRVAMSRSIASRARARTVKVYLPRYVRQEPKPAIARTDLQAHRSGSGETILVVEDDEEVRRSCVEALREMGYEVLEAGDAMDGVRLIVDRGGIDLLFTDVGLPGGVNGRALADAARSAHPSLRVLFTTGYTHNAILHNGVLDQGVHFIAKPFNLANLATKVREVLDTPATAPEGHVL